MITPRVALHISCFGHVALDTGGAGRVNFVLMVAWEIVLARVMCMAGRTQFIAFDLYLCGMGVVAVRTLDALVIHLALNEGPVNIDFIHDLTIGMIRFWP